MPITIQQIAEAAGVSTATVDRVLNDRPGVNPATVERVRAVMQTLGAALARNLPQPRAFPKRRKARCGGDATGHLGFTLIDVINDVNIMNPIRRVPATAACLAKGRGHGADRRTARRHPFHPLCMETDL